MLIGFEYEDPQAGWLFTESAAGLCYATEAAAVLRDWGFCQLGGVFVSYISPYNAASIRVTEHLGAGPSKRP